jgi:hypothetical protein
MKIVPRCNPADRAPIVVLTALIVCAVGGGAAWAADGVHAQPASVRYQLASSVVPASSIAADDQYIQTVARPLVQARENIGTTMTRIINDSMTTQPQKAQLIRDQVVAPLTEALQTARNSQPSDPDLTAVHQDALAALADSITAYETFAQALDTGSSDLLRQGIAQRDQANAEWQTWIRALGALPR